jgi:hypothetical protein
MVDSAKERRGEKICGERGLSTGWGERQGSGWRRSRYFAYGEIYFFGVPKVLFVAI